MGICAFAAFLLAAIVNGAGFADEGDDLTADLRRLVADPRQDAIMRLVETRRPALMDNPDLAVLVVIALRESGQALTAATLAAEVRSRAPALPRRLLYEEAFSHWHGGGCRRAMPLFMRVRTSGDRGDALRREATTMLVLCSRELGGWRRGLNPVMGYSDDLGSVGGRKTITPETGSRLDTLIASLTDAFPDSDIPRTITIGETAASGMWVGGRGYLGRTRHEDGIRHGLDFTGEGRIASRNGYRQMELTARASRFAVTGRLRPATVFALEGRYIARAGGLKALNEIALGMDQSWRAVWARNVDGVLGVRGRLSRTRSSARSDLTRRGFYAGLTHLPSGIATGWQGEIYMGNQTGTRYHAADFRRISIAVGPLAVGDGGRVYIGHSIERLDYANPRPWLSRPHEETRHGWRLRLTYPLGQGSTVGVSVNLLDRKSRDSLDNGRNLALDIEIFF